MPDVSMVKIVYHGPPASHPVGGLATGQDYGNHADGDTFFVWPADQEAAPGNFTLADKAPAKKKAVTGNKSKGTADDSGDTAQTPGAGEKPQESGTVVEGQPPAGDEKSKEKPSAL